MMGRETITTKFRIIVYFNLYNWRFRIIYVCILLVRDAKVSPEHTDNQICQATDCPCESETVLY